MNFVKHERAAIINWTLVFIINPNEPNAYYSKAIVKNEFYTWKSVLRDYDKAIEIAPDFISALTNIGAIADYSQVNDLGAGPQSITRKFNLISTQACLYFCRSDVGAL